MDWLRRAVAEYELDLLAVFRRNGTSPEWPLVARDANELEFKLTAGGHFVPLPEEPAALANILEVSLVDFVLERLNDEDDAEAQRGTERGYPDFEVTRVPIRVLAFRLPMPLDNVLEVGVTGRRLEDVARLRCPS